MSIPDRFNLARVQALAAAFGLETRGTTPDERKEAAGQFTEYVCRAFHAEDPGWGYLMKNPGQNQYNGHAVDYLLYLPAMVGVDIIGSAGGANTPGWSIEDPIPADYASKWRAPDGVTPPQPPVDPPATPPSDSAVLAALADLAGKVDRLSGRLDSIAPKVDQAAFESLNAATRSLDVAPMYAAVQGIAARGNGAVTFPSYEGSLFGVRFTLSPKK